MNYKIKKTENKPYYKIIYGNKQIKNVSRYLTALIILGNSKETIRTYCYCLLALYRWLYFYGKELREIKRSDLYNYITFLKKKKNSSVTINIRLVICNCYYNFLFEKDIQRDSYSIQPSPFFKGSKSLINEMTHYKKESLRHIKVKNVKKIIETLNKTEINLFIKSLNKYRDVAIVMLMYLCGLRSKEILELESSNVNLIEGHIRILGKGNKERIVPLPSVISDVLKQYIKIERPDNIQTSKLLVILKGYKRGNPMTKDGLRNLFRYHRYLTKINKANPHKFRHSFGSEMAKEGMPLPILQKLMGHESIDITMKYVHLNNSDVIEKYNSIMEKINNKEQIDLRYTF